MNGPQGATSICALALSPNRRYLAVAEEGQQFPLLSVFDLRTLKRRRVFAAPSMAQAAMASGGPSFRSLASLAFSADNRHLAAVSEGAEAVVMEWQWQKEQLTAVGVCRQLRQARALSYAPHDAALLLLSGDGGFALLSVDWDSASIAPAPPSPHPPPHPTEAVDGEGGDGLDVSSLDLGCHAWLDGGRCLFGARQGLLLVARNGRVLSQCGVHDGGVEASASAASAAFHPAKAVHSLTVLDGRVAVGCDGGVVQVYRERHVGPSTPRAASSFPLMPSQCHLLPHHPVAVVHVALSPGLEDVVAVTESQQAFLIPRALAASVDGAAPLSAPLPRGPISPLLTLHHSGCVTGLSLCVRKPLAATCGVDRSIRLWNLLSLECELVVYFPECPLSVAFHPSGLHLLVGFSDKLRLCNVLLHEIRAYRELPIKSCMEVAFSHGGQAFACVNGTLIQVYDTYTGEQLAVFRGHTGQVRSLSWSKDDLRLVSAGVDGAVYQRKLGSAGRLQELVQKGCKFTCALVTEQERMYAVGDDRMLKEIVERAVHKTLDAGCVLTHIAVDHASHTSKLIAGTENGVIRSFAFPLTGVVKVVPPRHIHRSNPRTALEPGIAAAPLDTSAPAHR